jgi:hypothetical protein
VRTAVRGGFRAVDGGTWCCLTIILRWFWMGGGGLFWTRIWCLDDLWTGDIKGGGSC